MKWKGKIHHRYQDRSLFESPWNTQTWSMKTFGMAEPVSEGQFGTLTPQHPIMSKKTQSCKVQLSYYN